VYACYQGDVHDRNCSVIPFSKCTRGANLCLPPDIPYSASWDMDSAAQNRWGRSIISPVKQVKIILVAAPIAYGTLMSMTRLYLVGADPMQPTTETRKGQDDVS
jgi:hypothetical protein